MDSSRVGLLSSSLVSIFCFKCTNTGLKMTLALLLKMEKVIILRKKMIIMRGKFLGFAFLECKQQCGKFDY